MWQLWRMRDFFCRAKNKVSTTKKGQQERETEEKRERERDELSHNNSPKNYAD